MIVVVGGGGTRVKGEEQIFVAGREGGGSFFIVGGDSVDDGDCRSGNAGLIAVVVIGAFSCCVGFSGSSSSWTK